MSEPEITVAGFNALLNAAVDGMVIIADDGSILNFNRAAESLFGYSVREVLNKNVNILMPNPYRKEHDRYMQHYQDTGKAKIIGIGRQVSALKKDGTVFPINLSVGEYSENEKQYFIGIIRDLTHQVETERMANTFRNRLAHVDRVSTMGEMASGISHELNQPLAAIGSYAQACLRRLDQDNPDLDKVSDILRKVEDQALRAGKVIERIRSLVKSKDIVRKSVAINDVVQEAIDLAQADADCRGVTLEVTMMSQNAEVIIDSVQIQQVVLNLIRNAVDAMEEASGVEPGCVTIGTRQSNDPKKVEVWVRDEGGGISKEVRGQLFHPFVSSKPQGTGLGLSISQSIVEAHQGELWAEDCSPGTVFRFSLPLASDVKT